MTQGAVKIELFGPPLESSFTPTGGWLYGPGGEVLNSPKGLVNHRGRALGKGPSGLPLKVPYGCDSAGPRELLRDELDHNFITQYTQFLMFMGMVDGGLTFYDGSNTYAGSATITSKTSLLNSFYVMPTTVAEPSGQVSAITLAAGSAVFRYTSANEIIPASPGFTVESFSRSVGETYVSLTTSLTAGSSSFNVAQVGTLPAYYDTTNTLYLLGGGSSPSEFAAFNTYSTIPTTPVAIFTTYQLSSTYTVPASGAITFEYTITATL